MYLLCLCFTNKKCIISSFLYLQYNLRFDNISFRCHLRFNNIIFVRLDITIEFKKCNLIIYIFFLPFCSIIRSRFIPTVPRGFTNLKRDYA